MTPAASPARKKRKASKIIELISRHRPVRGARILDVGTGSGLIATDLSAAAGPDGEVWSVDIIDRRQVEDGFLFQRVQGTALPFEDRSFELVVSNHVVEHVGDVESQLHHLREVGRVLAPEGIAYVATPSRWTLIEPHVGLPLVGWLPERARTPYVRLSRRAQDYDCRLLGRSELVDLLRRSRLAYVDRTLDAARFTARIEFPDGIAALVAGIPDWLARILQPVIPTMVFMVRRQGDDA